MRTKGDIDRNIDEPTESIRRLAIEEQALRNEIEQKNKELKSKNKHLIEARNLSDKYLHRRNSQRSRVTKSVTAKTGQTIAIGDTVEICNSYTKFSTWPKVKAEKNSIKGTRNLHKYDEDRFGVVFDFEKGIYAGKQFNKIHFTTDSGKDTWRKAEYLVVHDDERGKFVHSRQYNWWIARGDSESSGSESTTNIS